MKIVDIPPYQRAGVNYDPAEGHFMMRELVASLRARGQLDGVEIDIDEGEPTDHGAETRDEAVVAAIAVGVVKRVRPPARPAVRRRRHRHPGRHRAGLPRRCRCRCPHRPSAALAPHLASLLSGEKCCALTTTDAQAMIVRRNAQLYGMNHKLTSVRYVSLSSTATMALVRKYRKGPERTNAPEVKAFVGAVVDQFVHAIEDEGADSVIIASPHQQCFLDEVRLGLDAKGYQEINLIGAFPAAIEMARAMVNMKLKQSARAYPTDALKAKPAFR